MKISHNTPQSKRGFTLSELLIASFITTLVVGAVISLSVASLKMYYLDSDYLEIEGKNRRLADDLIEKASTADELVVFYDITDLTLAGDQDRGDCLVFFNLVKTNPGNLSPDPRGRITSLRCFYLRRIPPVSGSSGPIGLWYFEATAPSGSTVTDPAIALTNFPRTGLTQVSGEMFNGSLPRPAPPTASPTFVPRDGIFTLQDADNTGSTPTVLVNLPTRLPARTAAHKAASQFNLTISLRK
jgi:hypothetical protein